MTARALGPIVAALAVAAALVGVKGYANGAAHLAAAETAAAAGDVGTEIRELARAARWTLAGWGPARAAVERLEALAARLVAEGREPEGLVAWEELAASVRATRSLLGMDTARFERARRAIAEIRHREAVGPGAASPEAYLAATAPRDRIAQGWAAVAGLAFLGWIGAGAGFFARGMTPGLGLRGRAAAGWAGAFAGLYALWLGALWMA